MILAFATLVTVAVACGGGGTATPATAPPTVAPTTAAASATTTAVKPTPKAVTLQLISDAKLGKFLAVAIGGGGVGRTSTWDTGIMGAA